MRAKLLAGAALSGLGAVCGALLLGGCGSGNAGGVMSAIAPPADLPWPPPAVERSASNTDYNFNGSEWAMKSPTASNSGSSLLLSGGGDLPWAIYAVTGLGTTNQLLSIASTFSESPQAPGDGTNLFIALANFDIDSWEWFEPESSPWTQAASPPQDYRSPGGIGYLAVALAGPGTATVDTVTFTTSGDFVEAPQNLTGEALMVELIELNWDSVANAQGYNIYRATKPDMSNKQLVNTTGLVPENTFQDEFIMRNHYYYYQVTAVGAVESAPSNIAQVWSHGIELPAPYNMRVIDRTAEMIRIGWDWDGLNPSGGFKVFVGLEPNFDINSNTEDWTVPNFHEFPRQNCEPEVIYYFKVCGQSGLNLGRMSEEISASVSNYWDWSDMQTIAEGQLPMKGVKIDSNELALAYFNGPNVDVAVSSAGVWSADHALPENGGSHIYSNYLDLAFSNGTYLVTAWESRAGDSWAAYGGPSSWTRDLVHGDGNTALFHPESGFFCVCSINADEMAIVQLFNRSAPDAPQLLLHTKSTSGGSWSQSVLRQLQSGSVYTPAHCLQYYNGDLYYLGTHGLEPELYFTSRDQGWVFDNSTDIVQASSMRMRKYLDLTRFSNEWYSTAYDAIGQNLYMLDEESPLPWNREEITLTSENSGYYARMDAEGDEAIVLYYGGGSYHFGLYSKAWHEEKIIVPGVDDFGNSAEIFLINGEPYFIFRDDTTGELIIARGVPPEV